MLVLSFLASNPEVRSIIRKYNWLCDDFNNNSICIPKDLDAFLSHVTYDKWQLPCCTHFSSSTPPTKSNQIENLHTLDSLHVSNFKRNSIPRYSGFSSISASITDNSITSSLNSRRPRTNSYNSSDSRGMGTLNMNFDDTTLHINKTEECPSDILITGFCDDKDILNLMQKIGIVSFTSLS